MKNERHKMKINDIHIKMFQAGSGDCILVEFEKADFRVLIDGGYAETYEQKLRPYLKTLSKEGKRINLLIISLLLCQDLVQIKMRKFTSQLATFSYSFSKSSGDI